ncbi:Wzz/FepE/Etk N-terminal domain-containing protein [Cecembia rubra]|uniref:LPS O-antigen subunit length determinant protein (WzzB/FepE family) n=1 Tax=Cecembia rubra TaxID=1485585 RepID=A0A2P8EA02_9BACT|nr:Wzz/FepE/Etk N-terminal domain-containing protein [Cecembia rubra]PSL06306.1 LPS O-antigen subunit length determinant protein (WzzB/FepE family) [Cecembia rubra]
MSDRQMNSFEDEIDLLALSKTVWNRKKTVLGMALVFVLIGLVISLISPVEYTASSVFIPQTSDSVKPGGSLGGLASLAGINLGALGGSAEIPPSLYPKIVSSVPFRKALLNAKIHVNGFKEPVSYKEFYDQIYKPSLLEILKKYTVELPALILEFLRGTPEEKNISSDNSLILVSEDENKHFKRLDSQLTVTPNEKEGFVSLSFVMPDPIMSAEMAKFAEELLQKEVINFKILNAKEQLNFTQVRFEEKKMEFEKIQKELAIFRDRNQNLSSASVSNRLQSLEAEFNFSLSVYNELAKQLEQAKLQVAKDTPVLSIIQPVTVPIKKSSPNRPLIIFIFGLLGIIFSVGIIIGHELIQDLKVRWNKV